MSIEAKMQGIIKSRNQNFYDTFDDIIEEMVSTDPSLDPDYMFRDEKDDTNYTFLTAKEVKKINKRKDKKGEAHIAQSSDDILREKIYNARKNKLRATEIVIDANANIYYTEDESSEFFGYTYDEIIGMHNNGVTIPDEILDWAYSMVDANAMEIGRAHV